MVRRCAVKSCNSTDMNIVSHRFPRAEKTAASWRDALGIKDIPIDQLIAKYVVCTLHFSRSDYRNSQSNFLNTTAIPKLPDTAIDAPEDLHLMDLLEGYCSKIKNVNRTQRDHKSELADKTIMVYEINEIHDIEALQRAEEQHEIHEDEQQQHRIERDNEDVELIEGGDEDEDLIMEYVPNRSIKHRLEGDAETYEYVAPKKPKFEPTSKYVRLENNVVIELGEEEDDGDEEEEDEEQIVCYEDQGNSVNQDQNSLDDMFIKNTSAGHNVPYDINQSHASMESKSPTDEIVAILHEQIENDADQDDEAVESDYDEGEFAACSRKDLIQKILDSNIKIHELKTKLETIEGAQAEMVKSIENFKKIFSS